MPPQLLQAQPAKACREAPDGSGQLKMRSPARQVARQRSESREVVQGHSGEGVDSTRPDDARRHLASRGQHRPVLREGVLPPGAVHIEPVLTSSRRDVQEHLATLGQKTACSCQRCALTNCRCIVICPDVDRAHRRGDLNGAEPGGRKATPASLARSLNHRGRRLNALRQTQDGPCPKQFHRTPADRRAQSGRHQFLGRSVLLKAELAVGIRIKVGSVERDIQTVAVGRARNHGWESADEFRPAFRVIVPVGQARVQAKSSVRDSIKEVRR